jgi:hypothetical protein
VHMSTQVHVGANPWQRCASVVSVVPFAWGTR